MTLAMGGHFWKNIRGISDLSECYKTRSGKRSPPGSSRARGKSNLGYSFTTKRVKSVFPAMRNVLQLLFIFSFLKVQRKEENLGSEASDFFGEEGMALSLPQSGHLPSQGCQNKGKGLSYQNLEVRRNPALLKSSL